VNPGSHSLDAVLAVGARPAQGPPIIRPPTGGFARARIWHSFRFSFSPQVLSRIAPKCARFSSPVFAVLVDFARSACRFGVDLLAIELEPIAGFGLATAGSRPWLVVRSCWLVLVRGFNSDFLWIKRLWLRCPVLFLIALPSFILEPPEKKARAFSSARYVFVMIF
jgi:hypothetical protein